MPYVTPSARKRLRGVYPNPPETSGELNYIITTLLVDYLKRSGTSYGTMNEIVGVLECAKQEFVARVMRSYEDEKCATNGDVY